MPDNERPTLTGARVLATGAEGKANIIGLKPIHVQGSGFVLNDGEMIYVLDGELEGSSPEQPPHLFVARGKMIPSDNADPAAIEVAADDADVRDQTFSLPETITVEGGNLIPPRSHVSIEGGKERTPGRIERWLAGDKSLA